MTTEFKIGEEIYYVPFKGSDTKIWERGVVHSITDHGVFCRFYSYHGRSGSIIGNIVYRKSTMVRRLKVTPQLCSPSDLVSASLVDQADDMGLLELESEKDVTDDTGPW